MTERTIFVVRGATPALRRIPAGLAELAAYRELLGYMTVSRLRVRYRDSWLGWAWAVLQPLAFLGFLSVVGLAVGGHTNSGVAYPLFVLASLSPWTFFATSLSTSAAGVLNSRSLLAKVYFPREIVPFSYVFAALADLAIATALAMAALACTGHGISVTAIQLLPISLILVIYAVAFSLLLSSIQIEFRDIAIGLPLLLQGLMFTTPVLYPLESRSRALARNLFTQSSGTAGRGLSRRAHRQANDQARAARLCCCRWPGSVRNCVFRI